ncbi:hypothetical protein BU14_0785s0007 [Porphyra umbilicalis]|uniref:Uncharacterized protein n=1 Tax=Porphyra umbilicalis TaxID=2786 RepID=A0A1X6NP73_PORUM|nr:hypothetical protein BU14_0785s0007 [Porphyra umbilicalis]|eukprot:OSX70330.1 hypothetical protein BU14_0785s0007 [Porphyra umbilicalis]
MRRRRGHAQRRRRAGDWRVRAALPSRTVFRVAPVVPTLPPPPPPSAPPPRVLPVGSAVVARGGGGRGGGGRSPPSRRQPATPARPAARWVPTPAAAGRPTSPPAPPRPPCHRRRSPRHGERAAGRRRPPSHVGRRRPAGRRWRRDAPRRLQPLPRVVPLLRGAEVRRRRAVAAAAASGAAAPATGGGGGPRGRQCASVLVGGRVDQTSRAYPRPGGNVGVPCPAEGGGCGRCQRALAARCASGTLGGDVERPPAGMAGLWLGGTGRRGPDACGGSRAAQRPGLSPPAVGGRSIVAVFLFPKLHSGGVPAMYAASMGWLSVAAECDRPVPPADELG